MKLSQLRSHRARARARIYRPLAEPLEDRKLLASLLALSDANTLVRFDSANLATPGIAIPITGVLASEQIRGIDVRPRNGSLYALTTQQVGTQTVGRLYVISLSTTGATAQRVNPTANFLVDSEQIGIDFNPMSDRLRVVTAGSDRSIAVDPATGSAIQYDPNLTFAVGYTPPPLDFDPEITAIAYGNNVDRATSTTLFGYEFNEDDLVTIGIMDGQVTKVGDSGVIGAGGDLTLMGLDIEGTSTTAFAAMELTGGSNRLLSIVLASGAATDLGAIPVPAGTFVRDLAVAPVPRVQFELADSQFDENVGTVTGRVRRTGDLTGTATVTFQTTTAGTATAGTDFTATTTSLTFADGQEFAMFSVSITDDALAEPDETIGLLLTGPSTGSTLGGQSTATLTIRANDPTVAPAPRVQFELADYQFDENVGTAMGRVRRTGDLTGTVTVTFRTTTAGTATAGTDFTATTTPLTFADGQEFATFSVPITDDALAEPVETIGLFLTSPSTGSTLGDQSTATLTIRASDPDTIAPTIVSVRAVIAGRRRNRRIESILVTFSERIDPARAQNLANYLIQRPGRFRRSPFTNFGISSASYNDSTRTVTLIPAGSLRVNRGSQLVIRGTAPDGIADLEGNFLAGGNATSRLI